MGAHAVLVRVVALGRGVVHQKGWCWGGGGGGSAGRCRLGGGDRGLRVVVIGTGITALAGTVGGVELRPWDVSRLDDLARLVGAALPDEALTADELQLCCYDDPSVVVGIDDAAGPLAVGAVSVADHHGFVSASVKLLVVRPGSQRSGIGRAVLEALEREARSAGATTISLGGSVPSYLWPAVDVSHLGMLCLAEAAGYRGGHLDMTMSLPVTFRGRPPEGIVVERRLAD